MRKPLKVAETQRPPPSSGNGGQGHIDNVLPDVQAAASVHADVLNDGLLDPLNAVQGEFTVGLEVKHLYPYANGSWAAEMDIVEPPVSLDHRNRRVPVGLDACGLPAVDGFRHVLVQPSVCNDLDGMRGIYLKCCMR